MAVSALVATENGRFDASLYCTLAARVTGLALEPWDKSGRFDHGRPFLIRNLPSFMIQAAKAGVRHAIVAVDNDGGSKRRIEHAGDHDAAPDVSDWKSCCSECLLRHRAPPEWRDAGGAACIVVPVQALETWLLAVRGWDFDGKRPEDFYSRVMLKRRYRELVYGINEEPEEAFRIEKALDVIASDAALERLRERPSFRRFEAQARRWVA